MSAFKRLTEADQIDNVLVVQPRYSLASGSLGWFGSPDISGGISLYGGARKTRNIFSITEYQSHAPNVGQTGNPILSMPITASVKFAYMTSNESPDFTSRTDTRWWQDKWKTVNRLYEDYYPYNSEYVTSSYDYYCLYFYPFSLNIAINDLQDNGSNGIPPTGSFCLESWVKPLSTRSPTNDFTIQCMSKNFWFGITGSNGTIALSSSFGVFATSSVAIEANVWNHVALSYDSTTRTGSFYLNLSPVGNFVSPSASICGSALSYLSVGNKVANQGAGFVAAVGSSGMAFHGFIGECRYWDSAKTQAQLSASAFTRLTGSSMESPVSYMMFNEGPLASIGPTVSSILPGSGALDYAGMARGRRGDYSIVRLMGFDDRRAPVWHPNDNDLFYPTKDRVADSWVYTAGPSQNWGPFPSSPVERMLVVEVPSAFYGRQIVPGSVRMTCRAFEDFGLIRVLVDDGRGGLYLSGSATLSAEVITAERDRSVDWNKVGNVFYGEGLIVIKDPSLMDFGRDDGPTLHEDSTMLLEFQGDSRIPVKTIVCRIDHGEFNASNNPTFYDVGVDGQRTARRPNVPVRATTVGIYNKDRELVAVARLADPVRIRSRDRLAIRLRMDF